MIKVYYNRLENDNIEMTRKMLTDILSYMKKQDKDITILKAENIILQNVSDEVEEKDNEIERLNNIINKAIEYIKEKTYNPSQTINDDRLEVNPNNLLDILEGVDKDEN